MKPFVAQRHRRRPHPTMHKFVNDLFNSSLSDLADQEFVATKPAVNIIEDENGFVLRIAVPGLEKEDLKIDVKDQVLTVSANRDKTTEEKTAFKRKEFDYSNFKRSFKLNKEIDLDSIQANYHAGLLVLKLNRKEIQTKSIEVK